MFLRVHSGEVLALIDVYTVKCARTLVERKMRSFVPSYVSHSILLNGSGDNKGCGSRCLSINFRLRKKRLKHSGGDTCFWEGWINAQQFFYSDVHGSSTASKQQTLSIVNIYQFYIVKISSEDDAIQVRADGFCFLLIFFLFLLICGIIEMVKIGNVKWTL